MSDLTRLNAHELAEKLASGEVSSVEATQVSTVNSSTQTGYRDGRPINRSISTSSAWAITITSRAAQPTS